MSWKTTWNGLAFVYVKYDVNINGFWDYGYAYPRGTHLPAYPAESFRKADTRIGTRIGFDWFCSLSYDATTSPKGEKR